MHDDPGHRERGGNVRQKDGQKDEFPAGSETLIGPPGKNGNSGGSIGGPTSSYIDPNGEKPHAGWGKGPSFHTHLDDPFPSGDDKKNSANSGNHAIAMWDQFSEGGRWVWRLRVTCYGQGLVCDCTEPLGKRQVK